MDKLWFWSGVTGVAIEYGAGGQYRSSLESRRPHDHLINRASDRMQIQIICQFQ